MQFKTTLLKHQKEAYEKLKNIKVGALYMDMGTGKTRTALELIAKRMNMGKVDKVLWLCPYSVQGGLKKELIKHLGHEDNRFIVRGIESLSSSIKLNSELLELVQSSNCFLIVDESHLIKNPDAIRTVNIIRLGKHCEYKLILNGTPISNSEADLFTQWYLLDWRILGYHSYWSFKRNHLVLDEFNRVVETLNVDYLTGKISPYTYQVTKAECLDLPEKTYNEINYFLPYEHDVHYNDKMTELLEEIDEVDSTTVYRLLTALQLITSGYIITKTEPYISKKKMYTNPMDNPRIQTLLQVVNANRKTIIYCKYTDEVIDVFNALSLKYGKESCVMFYGEMTTKEREKSLEKFEKEADFFIANKSCAGYGLNLQFCEYVIYYSNTFSYTDRIQSEDRVHRIGQMNNVHITDIVCNDTIDEMIVRSLRRKENLVNVFRKELKRKQIHLPKYINKDILYTRNNRIKVSRVKKENTDKLKDLKEE